MELTVTYWCYNTDCSLRYNEQVDTVKIRRGQRITLKCGYCGEACVIIQANRR